MARLGRGFAVQPLIRRGAPLAVNATIDMPMISVALAVPAISVTANGSQTVAMPRIAVTTTVPAMTISAQAHRTISMPVVAVVLDVPAMTVTVPVLPGDHISLPGQAEWNGFLIGTGTAYRLREVTGWRGLPSIDNLNVERPSRHGAWSARKLAQQRIVTLRLMVDSISDPTEIDTLLDQLDAVTGIGTDDTELPLVIKGYGAPLLAYGAVIDRDVPMDGDYSVGAPSVSLLIACSDPRLYGLIPHGITVPKDVPTAILNSGNTATDPTVQIPGPAVRPVVTNQTTGRLLDFDLTLALGETLEINTKVGTAVVGATSVMRYLTGSSTAVPDWVLDAGSNTILYTTTSGGTGADVLWSDAKL